MILKNLKVTLVNEDIFVFEDGSYDRYTNDGKFFYVYLEDNLLDMFNLEYILHIEVYDPTDDSVTYE